MPNKTKKNDCIKTVKVDGKEIPLKREQFIKIFKEICRKGEDGFRLWESFVSVTAYELYTSTALVESPAFKGIEKHYEVFKKYEKEFAIMLNCIVEELDRNPRQDLLGSLFMELELNSSDKQQIFTPYHMSEMLSRISMDKEHLQSEIDSRGYIMINDPCAGGGSILVGAFNTIKDLGFNPQTQAVFVAQELSFITALSCYVQMALLGMVGYVQIGDTLYMDYPYLIELPMNNISPLWLIKGNEIMKVAKAQSRKIKDAD